MNPPKGGKAQKSKASKPKPSKEAKDGWRAPTDPIGIRIHKLFRMKPATPWNPKWIKAFKQACKEMGGPLSSEDMDAIEAYYAQERAKGTDRQGGGIHRRDIAKFLNNLSTEFARAINWKNEKSDAENRFNSRYNDESGF